MKCDLEYTNDSLNDLRELPKSVLEECTQKLIELEQNIDLGQYLEDKNDRNLLGCYKIYFAKAKYRIVYKKKKDSIKIIEIAESSNPVAKIIAIGKRNNEEVYKKAYERLKNK